MGTPFSSIPMNTRSGFSGSSRKICRRGLLRGRATPPAARMAVRDPRPAQGEPQAAAISHSRRVHIDEQRALEPFKQLVDIPRTVVVQNLVGNDVGIAHDPVAGCAEALAGNVRGLVAGKKDTDRGDVGRIARRALGALAL